MRRPVFSERHGRAADFLKFLEHLLLITIHGCEVKVEIVPVVVRQAGCSRVQQKMTMAKVSLLNTAAALKKEIEQLMELVEGETVWIKKLQAVTPAALVELFARVRS